MATPNGKRATWIIYGISLIVYTLILLYAFSIRGNSSAHFGFALLIVFPVIPAVSFVSALILQLLSAPLKWIYSFAFAAFGIAFLIAAGSRGMFHDVWLVCAIPPFLGAVIGFAIHTTSKKNKKN